MKQPSDQLKLGAILSYVSTGMNMAVQLLYTPLMIRLLGQSEYGLYTLVGSVVSYRACSVWALRGHICAFIPREGQKTTKRALPGSTACS